METDLWISICLHKERYILNTVDNPTGCGPGLKTKNKREMNTAFTSFCFPTANKIGLAPQAPNPTTFSLQWILSLRISKIKPFFKKAWFQYSLDITLKWTAEPYTSFHCNIICWGKCFFSIMKRKRKEGEEERKREIGREQG